MQAKRNFLIVAVVAAGLALAACGGDGNPSAPSGTEGVAVRGVLLGEGATFASSSTASASSSGGPITVEVEGTSISVTISGNGTWEFDDFIPGGTFTLVFYQDDVEIGRVEITAEDGVEVNVVAKMDDGFVVVVKLEFEDDDDEGDDNDDGEDHKVEVCHAPPGNPDNAKTITIDNSAVDAHLAHGDSLGECPEGGKKDDDDDD